MNSVLGVTNSVLDLIIHEKQPPPTLLSVHFCTKDQQNSLLQEIFVLVTAQISPFVDCYAKIVRRLPYIFCSPHYTWSLTNNLESGVLVKIKIKKQNVAFESKRNFLKVGQGEVVQSQHKERL